MSAQTVARWFRATVPFGAETMNRIGFGALTLIACLVGFGLPQTAVSHSNEYLETVVGSHGGMLRMSGPYHLELVVKKGQARVWVTDHSDNPQSTEDAQGQLMVMKGTQRFLVTLSPAGENELRGNDPRLKEGEGLRAVLTISMVGQGPAQARFAPARDTPAKQEPHANH